jgi:hypothetical protein
VTTLDDVRAEECRRWEAAQKWRPGQAITTPGTRLRWDCLTGWVEAWGALQRRRVSSTRYRQESNHIQALPPEMIEYEADPAVLYAFLEIMASNSGNRPRKGRRAGHPTTEMVMVAGNRLAQLGAVHYHDYRHQQGLRRAVLGAAPGRDDLVGELHAGAVVPHLSLF